MLSAPIEIIAKERLHKDATLNGDEVWSSFVLSKSELIKEVISVVGNQEPNLSDHGERHIHNVMENVGKILGLSGNDLQLFVTNRELIALLMSALLHDIGNIEGRKDHQNAIAKVLESLDATKVIWRKIDLKAIERICKAHTGLAPDGTRNTLGALKAQATSFLSETVRASHLAAVLRYADELAEGPQRTSMYLLRTGKYDRNSRIYHMYAKVTHVNIDYDSRTVEVDYILDIDDPMFGNTKREKKKNLKELISYTFMRASKLERERRYNRHYAPELILFNQTYIRYMFTKGMEDCEHQIEPILLNDIAVFGQDDEPFSAFRLKEVESTVNTLLRE